MNLFLPSANLLYENLLHLSKKDKRYHKISNLQKVFPYEMQCQYEFTFANGFFFPISSFTTTEEIHSCTYLGQYH